ncbi:hypothetical protein ATC03_00155 [Agromyces aureus]|uniref:Uncharacterized protein n=1 Tax=Agromyces aureus TaxID=453304 RepID=A0A191WB04_9MICO|nr:hypothetical protein ATC03_00155 [Agromyces aureus]
MESRVTTTPSSGPYVVPFTTTESEVPGSAATALVAPTVIIMRHAAAIAVSALGVRRAMLFNFNVMFPSLDGSGLDVISSFFRG